MAFATNAAGTQALVPSSTQEPSGWGCSAFVAGLVPPGRMTSPTSSAMAAVRMVSPLLTPGNHAWRCAGVPNWAMGAAP